MPARFSTISSRRVDPMRRILCLALVAVANVGEAQSIESRLAGVSGRAQFEFTTRPEVCGDGRTFISHVLGDSDRITHAESMMSNGRAWAGCAHGPGRTLMTVVAGEITRMRT